MKQFQFLILAISVIYFSACSDPALASMDSAAIGTVADIKAMLSSENIEQTFIVSNDDSFEIITTNRTVVSGGPKSFVHLDGSQYSGNLALAITEILTKSDLIRYGFPTLTDQGEILISDGEFKLEAKGGSELKLAPGNSLTLRVPNNNPSREAYLFDLSEEETWSLLDSQMLSLGEWEFDENDWEFGYLVGLSSLDWRNVDYFLGTDTIVSNISVCLPVGYNGDNTLGFIVFADEDIVLETESRDNVFEVPLPVGARVHLVFITSEGNDQFRIAKKEITIRENVKENLEPQSASEADILQCLNDLN